MSDTFPYALYVEGKWDPKYPKLKNKLTLYFQKKKKSNGGDCEVQHEISDGGRAIVRFKTQQVRQNVLEKSSHEIELGKDLLTLKVYLPPAEEAKRSQPLQRPDNRAKTEESSSKDEQLPFAESESEEEVDNEANRSAVLENIQNIQNFSQEFLAMLVENVLKESRELKDLSIEVIPENNCAVVTFATTKAAENFILKCPNNSVFKKNDLKIRPLEITKKVKAEDLPPDLNSDYIMLYFEKRGKTNVYVDMFEEEQSAIITFEDPAAVSMVLRDQHQIKSHSIRVFPYYDSLETALYGKRRPALKLPDAFNENIDRYVWRYLQQHQKSLEQIKKHMLQCFSELDFKDSGVRLTPVPQILQNGAQTKKLIQTWRQKASTAFTKTMSKYMSWEFQIEKDALTELETEIHKLFSCEPVYLTFDTDQATMVIAGLAEDVQRLRDAAQSTIDKIGQKLQRQNESITDEISMVPSLYEITLQSGLQQEICNMFPALKMNYSFNRHQLTLHGLKQEVLESKNKVLQEIIGLSRRMVELHPSVLEFMTEGDQEHLIKCLFLTKGIKASLEIKKKHAFIVAKTEKNLNDGEAQLSDQLHYTYIDIEDSSVLKMPEWKELLTSLHNMFNSSERPVLIKTSHNKVEVSGFAKEVQLAELELSSFVLDKSHITTSLQVDEIVFKFIKEQKNQDWFEKLENKVKVDFKDGSVTLSGPRSTVSECMLVFQELISSVYCSKFEVDKPGARKCFESKKAMLTTTAKTNMGCLLELVKRSDTSQMTNPIPKQRVAGTPNKVEITVKKGNICYFPVDAVVNPVNAQLQLIGGLSKALSNAAGPQLQEACNQIIKDRIQLNSGDAVLTDAGQLRCKHVIHAVGPPYDHCDSMKAVNLLKKAVKMSLELANKENCQSIAIPAISSGYLGFPLKLCADTIVAALKEFFEYFNGTVCLKKVYLIDVKDSTIEALEAAVQRVYGDSPTSPDATRIITLNRHQQNLTNSSNQNSLPSIKANGLKISLLKCCIQNTTMDVVVNSILPNMVLTHGAIPDAISTAAGPRLQMLLNQQGTAPASTGEVFVTAGCNLKNKLVFHAVAPYYKQGQGSEQMLEAIVDKCLAMAENQKQGSIVFPAFGTGNLKFPKTLVASHMLDSVKKFSENRTSRHLQEVVFALHPNDSQTIQSFTDEFNKKFNIQSSAGSGFNDGPFTKITSQSGIYETTVGGVVLQVLSGSITNQTTDVIVNSSNNDFTLKSGVSKAILDAAGPTVENECKKLGAQKKHGLIMTQQGNLQCKKIIHICTKSSIKIICERVEEALNMCAKQNFTSVAFPALGTGGLQPLYSIPFTTGTPGQGGVNAGQVADSMIDALVNFVSRSPQSSLKLVRIVLFQSSMLADFHQSIVKREATSKSKSRTTAITASLIHGFRDKDTLQPEDKDFVIEKKVVDSAVFTVCGPSQAAVQKTMQWLKKHILEEHVCQSISDPLITSLSDKDKQQIEALQKLKDVSIKVEDNGQRDTAAASHEMILKVEGLSKDVLEVVSDIQKMLKVTRDEIELKKNMELTCELVDWQYKLSGQYLSFDQKTNFSLEQAHVKSLPVDITIQGQVYKVTMPGDSAVNATGDKKIPIRRVDKMKDTEDLPDEWDPMKSNELCQRYPLQPHSKEYQRVLGQFKKTCNNKVLKIIRIQNPGMWKNYQTTKQVLEKKNGHQNNERLLFHGTNHASIDHINKNGFNRSYAGLNGTYYGAGTYFALNASYSAQDRYSVPDSHNQKHMYLCRVLTGDYILGNSLMKVPPKKNSTDDYDATVDNQANPTVFVVFRDYYAYPEYLIVFT